MSINLPARRWHYTQLDQVNQLVGASEADPDLGFMARTMALCSLPRTNPGNRKKGDRARCPKHRQRAILSRKRGCGNYTKS